MLNKLLLLFSLRTKGILVASDYFTDVFATFLHLETFQLCCCLWRVRNRDGIVYILSIPISILLIDTAYRYWYLSILLSILFGAKRYDVKSC